MVELTVATLVLLFCFFVCRNNKTARSILINKHKLIVPDLFSLKGYFCIPLRDITSIQLCKNSLALAISANKYPHVLIDSHSLENKAGLRVIYHVLEERLKQSDRLNNCHEITAKIASYQRWGYVSIALFMAGVYFLLYINDAVSDAILVGGVGKAVMRNTDFYRFFSAIFLHVNFFHLFFNICLLAIYSNIVGVLLGNVRYWNIFFTAGITGFLTSHYFSSFDYVVGASGAIYGVVGAFFVLRVKYKSVLPPSFMITSVKVILFTFLTDIFISYIYRDIIDFYSHMGGIIVGIIYALLICRNKESVFLLSNVKRFESHLCISICVSCALGLAIFTCNLLTL